MATSRTGTGSWMRLRLRLLRTRPHICHHCQRMLDPDAPPRTPASIEIDHLEPVALAPELALDPENCVLSCYGCNRAKGSRSDWTQRKYPPLRRSGALRRPAGEDVA